MLEFSKLTQKINDILNLNLSILCDHEYKFTNQVFARTGPKKYELQNHEHCSKCEKDIFKKIGE